MKNIFRNKSKRTIITLLFCIFLLTWFCTVVYSAFESTMNVDGTAFTRVEADVRITDFSISDTTNNSVSMYENFSKNSISSEVSLEANSSIIYNLEITNYGSSNVGIYDITGIPEGVSYSIDGYNLKDMICDDSGKCNSYAVKTYKLKIYTGDSSYEGVLNLQFDFRVFHNISYVGFTGSYVECVIDGDSVEIDLSYDLVKFVEVNGDMEISYSYSDYILKLNNVSCDINILCVQEFYNFDYTGSVQDFVVPVDGVYKIELWGARGGDDSENAVAITSKDNSITIDSIGGYGGYTSGEISLNESDMLYVYVGEQGKRSRSVSFNGGGIGGYGGTGINGGSSPVSYLAGNSGGGATDVRLVNGTWSNFDSLKSRIMVAAGGGGASINLYSSGGGQSYAGGLTGYSGGYYSGHEYVGQEGGGASQTSSGSTGINHYSSTGTIESGQFGVGGNTNSISSLGGAGGGGGGYFGGGAGGGTLSDGNGQGGGGGSSFVSGHNGCVAVSSDFSSSNASFLSSFIHYSGYTFTNTKIIDGKGYNWTTEKGDSVVGMPNYDGNGTMIGNDGNGYAKITLLELK